MGFSVGGRVVLDDDAPVVLGDRYLLDEQVGAGSTSEVWRARDLHTRAAVAVKVPRNAAAARDLLEEAALLSRLEHPHVLRLLDVVHDRHPALVLELAGEDLQARQQREGTLRRSSAARIGTDLLDALAHLHSRGVWHGDVKAANVLLGRRGRVLLCDLGSASSDRSGGTPEHLAPELASGGAGSAAGDVYAAGALVYELLTGRTPFAGGDSHRVLARHLREPVPVLPGLPPVLWELLVTMLAKDPAARPGAREAADHLRKLPLLGARSRLAAQSAPAGWESPGWIPSVDDDPSRTAIRGRATAALSSPVPAVAPSAGIEKPGRRSRTAR